MKRKSAQIPNSIRISIQIVKIETKRCPNCNISNNYSNFNICNSPLFKYWTWKRIDSQIAKKEAKICPDYTKWNKIMSKLQNQNEIKIILQKSKRNSIFIGKDWNSILLWKKKETKLCSNCKNWYDSILNLQYLKRIIFQIAKIETNLSSNCDIDLLPKL